jgi:hypothetical protein
MHFATSGAFAERVDEEEEEEGRSWGVGDPGPPSVWDPSQTFGRDHQQRGFPPSCGGARR